SVLPVNNFFHRLARYLTFKPSNRAIEEDICVFMRRFCVFSVSLRGFYWLIKLHGSWCSLLRRVGGGLSRDSGIWTRNCFNDSLALYYTSLPVLIIKVATDPDFSLLLISNTPPMVFERSRIVYNPWFSWSVVNPMPLSATSILSSVSLCESSTRASVA